VKIRWHVISPVTCTAAVESDLGSVRVQSVYQGGVAVNKAWRRSGSGLILLLEKTFSKQTNEPICHLTPVGCAISTLCSGSTTPANNNYLTKPFSLKWHESICYSNYMTRHNAKGVNNEPAENSHPNFVPFVWIKSATNGVFSDLKRQSQKRRDLSLSGWIIMLLGICCMST